MENFVAFASTLYCKILVGALIIELVVIWLCKKKIIKKDKITSALSVGLVALALAICFPIYSMEKIKDIPYEKFIVACRERNIEFGYLATINKNQLIQRVYEDLCD